MAVGKRPGASLWDWIRVVHSFSGFIPRIRRRLPGIFVAGDVRYRSIKRVASAVGEGAMAVQFIHQYLSGV
jgi:thioredoxin reductase